MGLFNSGTNVLQIGRELLIAINPNETPNPHLIRFIGVFALMMVCLIQLFSARAGRVLNRFLALAKITFLLVLFGFGCTAVKNSGGNTGYIVHAPNSSSFSYAQALLVVLYSYDGWENATFVRALLFPIADLVLTTIQ